MNKSILWNGFEINKGSIKTKVGDVPYLYYSPQMTKEPLNVAIHGEMQSKEEWLCFNSIIKSGNLLKESIKKNSPFIAFDLYAHGEWLIEDKNFNITDMSADQKVTLIEKSSIGISEALTKIIQSESLTENRLSVISYSLGCSVALNLKLENIDFKTILLSPFNRASSSDSGNFLVFRGEDDQFIDGDEFDNFYQKLPSVKQLKTYKSGHEIPVDWINHVKDFIYLRNGVR